MKRHDSTAPSSRDLIIGAGPAGLTAAWELLEAGRPPPLVVEADSQVGGISKTIDHHGNRMDLGGHRFFSKSDWVMDWWLRMLPLAAPNGDVTLGYQQQTTRLSSTATPIAPGEPAFLIRPRQSRIFFKGHFFDYPVRPNLKLMRQLGALSVLRMGASYAAACLFPRKPEQHLEDFLINRFGQELYRTFFQSYTEKVWGVPCREISAEWGAQRIKGLSVTQTLKHALMAPFRSASLTQRNTETSLIEQFLYPCLGPGQLWETVAERVQARGGQIKLRHKLIHLEHENTRVTHAIIEDGANRTRERIAVDHVISTMPIAELCSSLTPGIPREVEDIASSLPYRDFLTVGLLVERMCIDAGRSSVNHRGMPSDNWIYIQEPHVRLGRLQIFNNWSPSMVAAAPNIWLGLEYFCHQGEIPWSLEDQDLIEFATRELESIGLIEAAAVLDARVVRVPKAYPAYFGSYAEMNRVRAYLDPFPNLFLVGRNGMHRYNNQDHSMLAAKAAVEAIVSGSTDKSAIWAVNTEEGYQESSRR